MIKPITMFFGVCLLAIMAACGCSPPLSDQRNAPTTGPTVVTADTLVPDAALLWSPSYYTASFSPLSQQPFVTYQEVLRPRVVGASPERPVRSVASSRITHVMILPASPQSPDKVKVTFTYAVKPGIGIDNQRILLLSEVGQVIGCIHFEAKVQQDYALHTL